MNAPVEQVACNGCGNVFSCMYPSCEAGRAKHSGPDKVVPAHAAIVVNQADIKAAADYNDVAIKALLDPHANPIDLLAQAFAAARLAERERCAKVADQEAIDSAKHHDNSKSSAVRACEMNRVRGAQRIAAAIRETAHVG